MNRILLILGMLCLLGETLQADINTGLQFYAICNETSGTVITDSSGNGFNGTFVNGPFTTTAAPAQFGSDTAIQFTAADLEYITVSHNAALNPTTSGWTLAFWAKNTVASGSTPCLFGKGSAAFNSGYEFYMSGGAIWHVSRPVGVNHQFSNPDFNDGAWHHVVCVGSHSGGSTSSLYYLDGTHRVTFGPVAHTPTGNTNNLEIARRFINDLYYEGALYEIRFYSRALSAADVTELYAFDGSANSPVVSILLQLSQLHSKQQNHLKTYGVYGLFP